MASVSSTANPNPNLAETPGALADLVKAGTSALEAGDLPGALEKFATVVDSFPDQPEGHNNLGALYTSLGEYDKAEACFEKVLNLLPDNPNILYNRGVIRTQLEKFDAARRDFQAVLALNPDDPDTYNNLGVTAYMQGHFEEAGRCFDQALKLRPDYANAVINLCDVESARSNQAAAVQHCEDFLAHHDSIEVRRRLLDLLGGRCREALEQASRTAESLLMSDGGDTQVRQELSRLVQAKAALDPTLVG